MFYKVLIYIKNVIIKNYNLSKFLIFSFIVGFKNTIFNCISVFIYYLINAIFLTVIYKSFRLLLYYDIIILFMRSYFKN